MSVIAVIGAQWGDEGKGKIVDLLAEHAKVVVRFSGGDNAGHTVINQYGEFGMHLIPSGIFYPGVICVIGNGVAINPQVLIKEIEQLEERGVNTTNLFISDRAHLIMPYHILLDGLEEESRAGKAIGTTRKGIGPAFSDKTARLGIRVGDILEEKALLDRLGPIVETKNAIITKVYGADPLSVEEICSRYLGYGKVLAPRIRNTVAMLQEALDRDEPIMLEGGQGALLDLDFGTYPFTTSSSPLAGNSCLGSGIGPRRVDKILGVVKAYCTRVGSGPMPTELRDETGDAIRERAHEYGTTTGRPRRCGWFDGVATRFTSWINSLTGIAITRLDVLDTLPALKICVGYEIDGKSIDNFPASVNVLSQCQPIYEELPGWQSPTSHIRSYEELPARAKNYVAKLEELVSCPVNIISVGAEREQTIYKDPM